MVSGDSELSLCNMKCHQLQEGFAGSSEPAGVDLVVKVGEVQDLERGRAGSAPPPPLGDGLMPSLTVMLANAKF